MTIALVSASAGAKASEHNQVFHHVNSGKRAVFTSNGIWTVPDGCHAFIVWLCGGGGIGNDSTVTGDPGDPTYGPGTDGGDSPLASLVVTGQAIGSSFAITIGAAGVRTGSVNGGTSSFGALLSCTGGIAGGAPGSVSVGSGYMLHGNLLFGAGYQLNKLRGYGAGGAGSPGGPTGIGSDGMPGICVITW